MNYEGKYPGHEFWTPWMCDFCSIHKKIGTHKNKAIHSMQFQSEISKTLKG